jgi:DNA modification methylase
MKDLFGEEVDVRHPSLADKYLMAPTSVLNKRSPEWQRLKRSWLSKGILSEESRTGLNKNKSEHGKMNSYDYGLTSKGFSTYGTDQTISVFDPVLCEIVYRWFCPDGGHVLDPFAGGSVRGLVANSLGYRYTGIELRQEQVDSNRKQAINMLPVNKQPQWYVGDSDYVLEGIKCQYDLIFSCPPYMGLEVYSDDENDLSNMSDEDFLVKYQSIISKACVVLKQGCYAVFVVGDLRDNKGFQKDFTGMTKQAFFNTGMKLYNELILVEPVGTKAMTMERGFKKGKLAKVHQNVYIFKKP